MFLIEKWTDVKRIIEVSRKTPSIKTKKGMTRISTLSHYVWLNELEQKNPII